MEYYIYRHIRLDTNKVFYIGKGKNNRAYDRTPRNQYWFKIIKKHGYDVEIIIDGLSEEEAFKKEIEFIKLYKSQGQCEANISEGGKGSDNTSLKVLIKRYGLEKGTQEHNRLLAISSKIHKGKKLKERDKGSLDGCILRYGEIDGTERYNKKCQKLSETKKELFKTGKLKPNITRGMQGKKHSEETKKKMRESGSAAHKNNNNSLSGFISRHGEVDGTIKYNNWRNLIKEKTIALIASGKKTVPRAIGYKHTEEYKNKMSEARMGNKNPNYGKKMSEEAKQKRRETNRRRKEAISE